MEGWLYWTFGGCAIAIAVIGVFLLLVGLDKTKEGLTVAGVMALIIAGGLGGASVTGQQLQEDHDLMDRLSWDSTGRGFVVVSTVLGETDDQTRVCGVLADDDDVVCINSTRILNYGCDYAGVSSALPDPLEKFSVVWDRRGPVSGILFEQPK